jgi:predicted amidohydrolase/ribosomal protein S18 acetylase RimI-like enzyme
MSRDTVDHREFEWKVAVRPMRPGDYDRIVELQRLCFPEMKPWRPEHIAAHLETFPSGQLVVEVDGEVVASSSSLVIDFDEYEEGHTWMEISGEGTISNHDPEGDTLYGIEVMVHPEWRGMKLARRLYEARKQLCRELNLRRIMVGGRIPGFGKLKQDMTVREYVERVQSKDIYDPVLTTQLANGFTLKRVIRSYLASDLESDGFATLLEWVNLDYEPDPHRRMLTSRPARICVVQYGMRHLSGFEDFAEQCEYFVDVGSGYKADFVVFPEIFTSQMLSFLPANSPAEAVRKLADLTPQYLDLFSDLAVKYNTNIIGGSHFTFEDERLTNTAYLFRRDGQIGKQRKLHITPNERRWWGVQPGDHLEVFDTDKGKVAILICYDVEFPELARIAVDRGARILFVPFCTDERQGYLRVRYCAQARCIENQVYVAIAGTVGNLPEVENMDIQYAQSAIFTPSDFPFSRDAIAAEGTPNVEMVVIHDVDLEKLDHCRRAGTVQNWKDRRDDLYEVRWKGEVAE